MVKKRIVLKFPHDLLDKPITYHLVKDYDLMFNILQAKVTPNEEGRLIIELSGKKENYARGVKYLSDLGISIQPLSQDVKRLEDRCTQCGACSIICPTGALKVERPSMEVIFDIDKCIGCELCVRTCPARAMAVKF